jgi:hypothetical protein
MNTFANSGVFQRYAKTLSLTLFNLLLAFSSAAVWAQNAHYKKPPTCAAGDLTATCTGSITGLGNGNVIITVSFPNATGTTTCTNPGGNTAPGQNPAAPAQVTGSAFFPSPKNGNLSFTLTTAVPPNPTPQTAGCPNGQWTAAFDTITFGCGTLTVQQETFQGSGVYNIVLTTQVCL